MKSDVPIIIFIHLTRRLLHLKMNKPFPVITIASYVELYNKMQGRSVHIKFQKTGSTNDGVKPSEICTNIIVL